MRPSTFFPLLFALSSVCHAQPVEVLGGSRDAFRVLSDSDGRPLLRGTIRMRPVLPGIVYRGGANNSGRNSYGEQPRSNRNPLPPEGLRSLCEAGFDSAIYLYRTNFRTAPTSLACKTQIGSPSLGEDNFLGYSSGANHLSQPGIDIILGAVHDRLTSEGRRRPMYLHCWNGRHASGYVAAVILRQFCDLPADTAVAYYKKLADPNAEGNDRIVRRIQDFRVRPLLSVDSAVKKRYCPSLANL